nr:type IV toxin-antitoxin system AbiEi family antitoxin [uncultured Allomuricauda sp.]|tara:strand:- start:188 stop:1189 length:1002 start_codon:yes stop_codon:yes gene_type:complete
MNAWEIIQTAVDNINNTGILRAKWLGPNESKGLDGQLELLWQDNHIIFQTEIKRELRNAQLPQLEDMAKANPIFLIMAQCIFPKIKEALRERKIAYLEANGNLFLEQANLLLWIDANDPIPIKSTKTNRAFTKTGLKVVYQFLLDRDWVNRPYREIAEYTGTGIGTITNVFNGLEQEGFLIKLTKNEHLLVNVQNLLEKWILAYEKQMKPTLFIGDFRFLNPDDFFQWRDIELMTGRTFWGGEPAGDIYTNYLRPEELTLYTNEQPAELMRNYRLVPEKNGPIKVYEKFWKGETPVPKAVHPILAYADLILKGDRRCRETANKLYNEYLQDQI